VVIWLGLRRLLVISPRKREVRAIAKHEKKTMSNVLGQFIKAVVQAETEAEKSLLDSAEKVLEKGKRKIRKKKKKLLDRFMPEQEDE
jgi:hypothetical protein